MTRIERVLKILIDGGNRILNDLPANLAICPKCAEDVEVGALLPGDISPCCGVEAVRGRAPIAA